MSVIDEGTWVENYFSEENGFTFKQLFSVGGGVLEVEEVTEKEVVQDINGKNLEIPTEEELKVLGVSREEFIMLAKQSDCAY